MDTLNEEHNQTKQPLSVAKSLTVHVRLTKACNADCAYCSSYTQNVHDIMPIEEVKKSVAFIKSLILNKGLGGIRDFLSIQYVGGEVTMLPTAYIKDVTDVFIQELAPLFKYWQHGVQTNLIASRKKLEDLVDIFGKNIGTSIDSFSNLRTVNGNSQKYRTIFLKSDRTMRKMVGRRTPAVVVVDAEMADMLDKELALAEKEKRDITLRPVFHGGKEDVNVVHTEKMKEVYTKVYKNWVLNSNIAIEPFYSLTRRRLDSYKAKQQSSSQQTVIDAVSNNIACPYQNHCALTSINLESNGDLFLCVEFADSGKMKMGNAIRGEFNEEVFDQLLSRQQLNEYCRSCDYVLECQGGCLSEILNHGGGLCDSSKYCSTWKSLFSMMDDIMKKDSHKLESFLQKFSIV